MSGFQRGRAREDRILAVSRVHKWDSIGWYLMGCPLMIDYKAVFQYDRKLKERVLRMKKFKGYIQIYTGNGKGKTTAALGLALRAAGRGYKTFIGQFIKGQKYGELTAIKRLEPLVDIKQFGRSAFIHVNKDADPQDIAKANKGLTTCLKAMLSGLYDIIILDEINVALYFNLIEEKKVHEFLDKKPENIEVILTGRYAPDSLIKRADLVTEMKEIKHYYTKKITARDGIER